MGGSPMATAPDRSFGGVSFVKRTGDRHPHSGVVLLRALGDNGDINAAVSNKLKKYKLEVNHTTLTIASKDGKKRIEHFAVDMCSFKLTDGGAAIEAVCPGLRFEIRAKDVNTWFTALKKNSSASPSPLSSNLRGSPSASPMGSLERQVHRERAGQAQQPGKHGAAAVANGGPANGGQKSAKPHLANREMKVVEVSKSRGASMGMKVCGGGGPDGDPARPEIFVFSLEPGGVAEKAGLRRGDIVISVGGVGLTGLHVTAAAKELSKAGGDHVQLRLLRKNKRGQSVKAGAGGAAAAVGSGAGRRGSNGNAARAPASAVKPAAAVSSGGDSKGTNDSGNGGDDDEADEGEEAFGFAGLMDDGDDESSGKATPPASSPPKKQARRRSSNGSAGSGDGATRTSSGEDFGFGGSPPASPGPASGKAGAKAAKEAKSPARKAPSPPTTAQNNGSASTNGSAATSGSNGTSASPATSPASEDRAAKLARLKAARKEKKEDYLADLEKSLKIIDDLPED